VIDVLNAIKSTDISEHLTSLDWEAQDTLMKYLYKGMEQPALYNTGVLLNWHEKVSDIASLTNDS
jgi:actin related protein 2/3 complex subunit 5